MNFSVISTSNLYPNPQFEEILQACHKYAQKFQNGVLFAEFSFQAQLSLFEREHKHNF